jgi:hypothetical protein
MRPRSLGRNTRQESITCFRTRSLCRVDAAIYSCYSFAVSKEYNMNRLTHVFHYSSLQNATQLFLA